MQQFVPVRVLQMNGVDIGLFQFDYDLTFAAVFLNANEQIYSRYGGRDHQSSDNRISLAGLKNTMREVLALHEKQKRVSASPAPRKKMTPEDFPTVPPTLKAGGSCIHCHQVNEFRWRADKLQGTFSKESLWGYPLPENVGLTLDVDRGNLVKAVAPDAAAHKAGLQAGDVLEMVNGVATISQADVQWGLFNAPVEGRFSIQFRRYGQPQTGTIEVVRGWKRTNNIWRASVRRQ
jgi:hypothetical protein